MAAGGNREFGGDEYFDFSCSPCERREQGTKTDAKFYCAQCNECFCKTCLEFHGSFQSSKDHVVIGRDKIASWRRTTHVTASLEKCAKHPGKDIEMYCEDHLNLLCAVCVSLKHRYTY